MSWKGALLTLAGSIVGSGIGAWCGIRMAQGCPVWPW